MHSWRVGYFQTFDEGVAAPANREVKFGEGPWLVWGRADLLDSGYCYIE